MTIDRLLGFRRTDHRAIAVCRDSKDDKFLELATNGKADAIVTGDADLCAAIVEIYTGNAGRQKCPPGPSVVRGLVRLIFTISSVRPCN